ncbi:hypothetical protein AM1_D0203 (plasmid) [Acaryochloris marina MBIC11017]|uniref:Uncharacterized protein n=1 Tax=Acaryochloris marina (strain MBIC 11017) TaxID=329726 RepID=A8ZNW2_ACAM1|nr:hypothetical protein AM1_D0203 [Acaryochloris marina MBIC11017]KAI9129700.1 hypothetical protein ON05_034030 [Acaryochloris sp. CCMEE 5410]
MVWEVVVPLRLAILLALALLFILHFGSTWQFHRSIEQQVQALRMLTNDEQVLQPPRLICALAMRSHRSDSDQGPSQDSPTTIQIHQTGEMRLSEQGRWLPFTATQDFAIRQPGFVWRAIFRLAPFIHIEVVDSYVQGKGRLEGRLLGSIPFLRVAGPSTDKGELMRYLAELIFFPAAFLNNSALHWHKLNEFTVKVTSEPDVGVHYNFDPNGDLVSITAPNRPRMVAGQAVETPWSCVVSEYRTLGGYDMPTFGQVSWQLEDGPFTYWRGRITHLETDPGN